MARLYGFDRDTAMKLRKRSAKQSTGGTGGRATLLPKVRGGSSRFFMLIEDSTSSTTAEFWAKQVVDPTGASPSATPEKVTPWVAAGAQAGYIAMYERINGKWYFSQGACFSICTTAGVLTVGTAPAGTVGVAYSHSVSGSGLTAGDFSTVDFEGLPPGLDHTAEAISGTPTEAGTFYVIVTATAPGSGDSTGETCTLTKVLVITIAPEEEE
jgi:hypothetical protein